MTITSKTIFTSSALAFVLFASAACTSNSDEQGASDSADIIDARHRVVVGEASEGTTVALPEGSVLVVSLPENPSTGYAWRVQQGVLGEPDTSRFISSGSTMVGAGGTREMSWTKLDSSTVGAKSVEVTLLYAGPIPNAEPRRFTFTLQLVSAECPTLSPPAPGTCEDGALVPVKDANGCITRYECDATRPVPACGKSMPFGKLCVDGYELTPELDDAGCAVDWKCTPAAASDCRISGCAGGSTCDFCFATWQCVPQGTQC